MGYVVRPLKAKSRAWKVQYQRRVGDKAVWRDVPMNEWATLGFRVDMSIDEARQIRDGLNARGALTRHESKRQAIAVRSSETKLKHRAQFPSPDLVAFEDRELYRLIKSDSVPYKKRTIHWEASKNLVTEVGLEISDWFEGRARFYDYCLTKKWSPSYSQKILSLVNKWGSFLARRRRVFFEPIPMPSGPELEALSNAHFERRGDLSSKPLAPNTLNKVRTKMPELQWNWLYLTVWFGLRPLEVDNLHKPQGPRTWTIDRSGKVPVLRVYQTKLIGKGQQARIKPIPCICKEQLGALMIIGSGEFKRPLVKTIQKYCGVGVTTYGGRKGFTDLWLGRGQKLENISIWLGHRSIERTWKSYKDKQALNWD